MDPQIQTGERSQEGFNSSISEEYERQLEEFSEPEKEEQPQKVQTETNKHPEN